MKKNNLLSLAFILTGSLSYANTSRFNSEMSLQPDKFHLSTDSGAFCTNNQNNVDFLATYNGWDSVEHKRIRNINIKQKMFSNIRRAKSTILASFFLFDNLYSSGNPESTVADELRDLLVQKKRENPNMKIAVILDPLNRAYSRRVARSLEIFRETGIDVFFTDLRRTKAATTDGVLEGLKETGQILSGLTGGLLGSVVSNISSAVDFCLPNSGDDRKCIRKLDGHEADLEMIFEAILLKANHRKVIVTDHDDGWRALVSSANPHNGSDDSTNTAIALKGNIAKFIYNNLREDVGQSLAREFENIFYLGMRKFVWLSDASNALYPNMIRGNQNNLKKYLNEQIPPININSVLENRGQGQTCSYYMTETRIKDYIIYLLNNVEPDDKIRIQMFYLSERDVVNKIIETAKKLSPQGRIQILLDPSKDAFNSIKDGTPNRQVGHFLKSESDKIELRWYATHGEQNHSKVFSITNDRTRKNILFTGSANWTGKNLNGANMESNVLLTGASNATKKFNDLFDRLWSNKDAGVLYSWSFDTYSLLSTAYLNMGYDYIKDYSEDEIRNLARRYLGNIKEHFLSLEVASGERTILNMSQTQIDLWVNQKIEKDMSTTLRAVSYIHGESIFNKMSEDQQQRWLNRYFRKWERGERTGYALW